LPSRRAGARWRIANNTWIAHCRLPLPALTLKKVSFSRDLF